MRIWWLWLAQVRRLSGHKFMNLNFNKYGWQKKLFGALISGRREIDKKDTGARTLAQDGLATIQVAYAVGGCSEESILTQYMKERLGAAFRRSWQQPALNDKELLTLLGRARHLT